jgi:hypothetical protein
LPQQLDDPGTLALVGFSAGARSHPSFGWARNIVASSFEDKEEMPDTIEELNQDTCAAYALFWNMCQSWLPAEITDEIDDFTVNSGLPPMNPEVQEGHDGDYSFTVDGPTVNFSGVRLAPPSGLIANNYARCALQLLQDITSCPIILQSNT